MVGQSLLLLADVQLLDVVNHLLLQAVLVVVDAFERGQPLYDALAYLLRARGLEGFDACKQASDVVQLLLEFPLQGSTFLDAEVNETLYAFLHNALHLRPFFVAQFRLHLVVAQHFGHPHQYVPPVLWLGYEILFAHVHNLLAIVVCRLAVDGQCGSSVLLLHPKVEIHLATFEHLGNHASYLHFLLAIAGCNACGQVQRLAVQRLDFCRHLFSFIYDTRLAVSSHRLYHDILVFSLSQPLIFPLPFAKIQRIYGKYVKKRAMIWQFTHNFLPLQSQNGKVPYGMLPRNPPGLDRSKGTWL